MKYIILMLLLTGCSTTRNNFTISLIHLNSERGTQATSAAGKEVKLEATDQDVAAEKTLKDSLNPTDSLNPDVTVP